MALAAKSLHPGSLLLLPSFVLQVSNQRDDMAPTQSPIPFSHQEGELVVASDRGWNFVRARPRQRNTNCVGIGRIAHCIIITSSNVWFVEKRSNHAHIDTFTRHIVTIAA